MKLIEITVTDWKTSLTNGVVFKEDNQKKLDILYDTLSNLYYKNLNRYFRPHLESYWSRIGNDYIKSNLQKIDMLLSTAFQDFISQDNKTTTTNSNVDYNVDYYGGEGQRSKDTATGEVLYSNINNKDKIRNYRDISQNLIFRELMNILFETFIEGMEW